MNKHNALFDIFRSQYSQNSNNTLDNLLDLLHSMGNGRDALLYSILFMPELVVIGDSVLLSWNLPNKEAIDRFLNMVGESGRTLEQLESSFNFIEVGYLFDSPGRNLSDDEDELLAQRIVQAWSGWLMASFPDRKFSVEVLSPEETGSTVGVHFFEVRK